MANQAQRQDSGTGGNDREPTLADVLVELQGLHADVRELTQIARRQAIADLRRSGRPIFLSARREGL